MTKLNLVKTSLTTLQVDAIVNAAAPDLLGGGGVDGAIHQAAGPGLSAECRLLGGCATGEAKITKGYDLPSKFIIHTVGPVYGRANGQEAELLAACYQNSLKLAAKQGIKTIAFPYISTGVYGYPKAVAAEIAVRAVKEFIAAPPRVFQEITFAVYDQENYEIYERVLKVVN